MTANPVEILLVDDRREDLLVIETILARDDYDLVRASSGPDALRRILERDFAVILVDVMMPGMDGFELVKTIKQRERSRYTPIIFLTAGGPDIDLIYRGYSVGAVDYLMKPLDADVLRAKVAIFVELFRKDLQIQEQAKALRAAERRELENELLAIRAANEQRYRNLAEAIPHIVWTASPDGAVMYFNRRWYEYTGQIAVDAKQFGWMAAVECEDAETWAADWHQRLTSHTVFEFECRLRHRDGESGWHLCRAVPEIEDDKMVGWLGTFTDCDGLKRAVCAAEKAVQERDEFLSIASHELRTPLTTLQLRLGSLNSDIAKEVSADVMLRKVDSAMRQGNRLVNLIDSLFDFSRLATGRLTLHCQPFDLVDAVQEVVDRLSELATRAEATIHVDHDGGVNGTWDRLRIEQVIENLLGNAIKYAPRGPIEVGVERRGERARISIADHGPGIDPSDLASVFGPFQRSRAMRNSGGLGLGLYVARAYAAAHGGNLEVYSEPGQGATFWVDLPLSATG